MATTLCIPTTVEWDGQNLNRTEGSSAFSMTDFMDNCEAEAAFECQTNTSGQACSL